MKNKQLKMILTLTKYLIKGDVVFDGIRFGVVIGKEETFLHSHKYIIVKWQRYSIFQGYINEKKEYYDLDNEEIYRVMI